MPGSLSCRSITILESAPGVRGTVNTAVTLFMGDLILALCGNSARCTLKYMRMTRLALFTVAILLGQTTAPPSEIVLKLWGGPDGFSKLYVQSIDTYFTAQEAYRARNYKLASEILKSFWSAHPAGSREWAREIGDEDKLTLTQGLNFGRPVGYYALRMLTECVEWKLRPSTGPGPYPVRLTVVMVGQSSGIEPASMEELRASTGHRAHHVLHRSLISSTEALDQSLFLFSEYIGAMTGGRLRVERKILHLADLDVPVNTSSGQDLLFAGLTPGAMSKIWQSIDEDTRSSTDWWFILYPSHVPEQYPEFRHTEFITGGMGTGPDGRSPAFIIDDLWLVRVPPHLGHGLLTEGERRAYLPQWFQHEFFHHLYRTYPNLKLEVSSHQWFDRGTWPEDFEGLFEPDYYAESLHKRLKSVSPPLQVALRYAPPSKELFGKITPEMMCGKYLREPRTNDWHQGVIEWGDTKTLRWTNEAGRSWRLTPDLTHGILQTGTDNPYHDSNPATGQVFRVVLRRDANGNYLPEVSGFNFNGEFYRKL